MPKRVFAHCPECFKLVAKRYGKLRVHVRGDHFGDRVICAGSGKRVATETPGPRRGKWAE